MKETRKYRKQQVRG